MRTISPRCEDNFGILPVVSNWARNVLDEEAEEDDEVSVLAIDGVDAVTVRYLLLMMGVD